MILVYYDMTTLWAIKKVHKF